MRAVAHLDDAESETEDLGRIGGTWTAVAEAVGCERLGAHHIQIPAGKAATPQHAEDEEVFYVLDGSGWSVQTDGTFAIAAGDVVHYRAWEVAHTVVAGPDGLVVLAMGTVEGHVGVTRFPRIGRMRIGEQLVGGSDDHQWVLENELPAIEIPDEPDPRPGTIVAAADVEAQPFGEGRARWCRPALGMRGISLTFADLGPGQEGAPPHCHSMEEELFLVLDGGGIATIGDEEHPLRAGSIVGRPPATGVAHSFRAGDDGMTVLMFSDKHGSDMTYYPRTGRVSIRGLKVTIETR